MPRPLSERRLARGLESRCFKPAGIPACELEEVVLLADEAEAIRLADLEGLYQEAAARSMAVSRQTFGRIIDSARRKVADALINGKCLRVDGGQVTVENDKEAIMKIAVPTRNGMVDEHFGHCEYFTVFTVGADGAVTGEERVDSPAGCGCKSNIASILAGMGVTTLVAGNMGDGAVRVLKANGITAIRGASGSVREAAASFSRGSLVDSGTGCAGHRSDCHHE